MTTGIHISPGRLGALALGVALTAVSIPAFAFGSDPSGGNKPVERPPVATQPPMATTPLRVCKKGAAWSQKKKACVKLASQAMPDGELLQQGRLLALAGYYSRAIPVLQAIGDKTSDPMVFTYLGYSHRKLGQTDVGIAYYHRALAIDPNSLNTHEYLGEGYAAIGHTQAARIELAKVETLCGNRQCEQYQDLAEAITAVK